MDDVLEPVATPDATGTTVPVTDTATPDETHPDSLATPQVPEEEAMWGDLKEDPPVTPAAPVVPQEFTNALSISDYVKEPAHVEAAVRTASEVWDVVSGKGSASALLEAMRGQNPQQYEKTILEDIVPYIEKITGKRFGATEAAPDPVAEMRAELERLKNQPIIEKREREKEQRIAKATAISDRHLAEFIKAGNGAFEGDAQGAIDAMAAQLPKLGITPDQLMSEILSGKTENLQKAYKAAEKAETLKAKAYSDRIRAKFKTLKAAVPASKGASAGATNPADGAPDLTTASGRAKAMADAFKAGRDTI